jgi:hypothetical protein
VTGLGRPHIAPLASIAAWAVAFGFSAGGFVLAFLPLMLLLASLLTGRYPGEAVLDRLRAGARQRSPRRSAARRRLPRQWSWTPRGGRLIALALAGRAPPLGG